MLDVAPAEGIRRLIRFTWDYYLAHPEFLSLLNSENLHDARHLRRSRHVQAMNSPLIETLATVLARGRDAGLFRGGVDPLQLYISIAALSYFYLGNNHDAVRGVRRATSRTEPSRAQRLPHMVDVILGYLRPLEPVARRARAGRVAPPPPRIDVTRGCRDN